MGFLPPFSSTWNQVDLKSAIWTRDANVSNGSAEGLKRGNRQLKPKLDVFSFQISLPGECDLLCMWVSRTNWSWPIATSLTWR